MLQTLFQTINCLINYAHCTLLTFPWTSGINFERFSFYEVDFAIRQHKTLIPRGNPSFSKTPENDVSVNTLPAEFVFS